MNPNSPAVKNNYFASLLAVIFPIVLLLLSGLASAQANSIEKSATVPAPEHPQEHAPTKLSLTQNVSTKFSDKLTPLKSIKSFLKHAGKGSYPQAAEYLDLRNLPSEVKEIGGAELARQLYVVLSRKIKLDMGTISDEPEGAVESGVPSYRDVLGSIESSQESLTLFLQRVPDGEGGSIWKVSNASVQHVPMLYKKYGYSGWVEFIRQLFPDKTFLGAEIFKWAIAIFASTLVTLAWVFLVTPRLSKILSAQQADDGPRIDLYLHHPVAAFIFVIVGYTVIHTLGIGIRTEALPRANTVIIIVMVWLVFATVDLIRDLYVAHLNSRGRESALMLVGPMTATFKMIVAALAFVTWLDNIGINITALVAGLGVGGLAIALVLQRPLEDILGAISLYTQQPVTVGQFCISGETKGTIEEIGIRTTKIRTIEKTLVAIPNAIIARASIENLSERPQILHRQLLRLMQNTPHNALRTVLSEIRDLLAENALVDQDSFRVRLLGFGEYCLEVEVFAYVYTTDWSTFLAIAEGINLDIMRILATHKVSLAISRF